MNDFKIKELNYRSITTHFGNQVVPAYSEPAPITIIRQDAKIKKLEALLDINPMTGLMNFQGFRKDVEYEMARVKRGASKGFVVVAIDLDGLKGINDTISHGAGDTVIITFAKRVRSRIRQTDTFCHKSGDEFWVLAKDATLPEITPHCERIIDFIGKKPLKFPFEEHTAKVSIQATYGLADYSKDSKFKTFEAIIDAADRALNDAKAAKGNKRGEFKVEFSKSKANKTKPAEQSP